MWLNEYCINQQKSFVGAATRNETAIMSWKDHAEDGASLHTVKVISKGSLDRDLRQNRAIEYPGC